MGGDVHTCVRVRVHAHAQVKACKQLQSGDAAPGSGAHNNDFDSRMNTYASFGMLASLTCTSVCVRACTYIGQGLQRAAV